MGRLLLVTVVLAVLVLGVVWASASTRPAATQTFSRPPSTVAEPAAPVTTPAASAPPPTSLVDSTWAAAVSSSTGIPIRALLAYASADLALDVEQPSCDLGWNTLAAIGWVETEHGSHDGAVLGENGIVTPSILGARLDGVTTDAISDTDDGVWDGDTEWDRAVGPMQFIPDTWSRWGSDGSGDGVADPNQIDDAALTTARYLCAAGSMSSPDGWRAAVHSFNHLDSYVDRVADIANEYASRAQ